MFGDGGILDPDSALEQLGQWKGRVDKLAADTKTMSESLQGLRVTLADENGLVEVTIDATGGLVDLRLGRRIQRVAPEVVARTIMTTIGAAKAKIAERSRGIIEETMGADSAAARAVADQVEEQLRRSATNADSDTVDPRGGRYG